MGGPGLVTLPLLPCVLGCFVGRFFCPFCLNLGAIWEHFGTLFTDFDSLVAFASIALPLVRKPTFSGLWITLSALVRLLFWVLILGCVRRCFCYPFLDFGVSFGSLLLPYGTLSRKIW